MERERERREKVEGSIYIEREKEEGYMYIERVKGTGIGERVKGEDREKEKISLIPRKICRTEIKRKQISKKILSQKS